MKSRAQKENLALDRRRNIYSILRGRGAEYVGTSVGRMVVWVMEKQNKINEGVKKW